MNSWRMPACLFAFGDGPRARAEIYLTSTSVEDFAAKSVRPCHMVSGVHYRGYLELHDCITSTIASTSTARKDELPGRL